MSRSAAFVVAGWISLFGSAGVQAQGAPQARVIDSLVKDAIDSRRISSASVAVVRGRDTVLLAAHGLAWRQPEIAATPETVYRMGSIAKQITAAIMLQLVDERRVSLDDSIDKFIPRLPASWKTVRIRELLNHTSGIPSYTNLGPAWSSRMTEDFSPDSLIALTTGKPLDFPTGSSWRYNNSGYVIVGRIIEIVEGKPYARVVDERIARKYGFASLTYCPTNPVQRRDAAGYETAPGKTFQDAAPISLTQPYAAGGLCITARDLVKWNVALHTGKVMSAASYQRMITPEGGAIARAAMDSGWCGIRRCTDCVSCTAVASMASSPATATHRASGYPSWCWPTPAPVKLIDLPSRSRV
jgi:D-alanyl-D-alanine carboxypeptidase